MGLRNKSLYHDKQIFFITTTCHKWLPIIGVGKGYEIVIGSLNFCLKKYKSTMLGYVIMPNHIHLILYFQDGKDRIDFMRDFKKFTSTMLRKEVEMSDPELLKKIRFEVEERAFKSGRIDLMRYTWKEEKY